MSYLIFDSATTKIVRIIRNGCWQEAKYETKAAAKAGLTRLKKLGKATATTAIASSEDYDTAYPVKYETVINLMSGKPVLQAVGTPRCCDVSSELYWSM